MATTVRFELGCRITGTIRTRLSPYPLIAILPFGEAHSARGNGRDLEVRVRLDMKRAMGKLVMLMKSNDVG